MLKKAELEQILYRYNVGRLKDYRRVWDKRALNDNIILETSKGKYLLKIFVEWSKEAHLLSSLNFLLHLRKNHFPSPGPILDRQGEMLFSFGDQFGTLLEYIEGRRMPTLGEKSLSKVARVIAQFHEIGKEYKGPKREKHLSLERLLDLPEELAIRQRNQEILSLISYLRDKSHTEYKFPQSLPRGMVHRDLHRGHFLFRNAKIVGVLDFEKVCVDYLIKDVGCMIAYNCYLDSELSQKRFDIVLSSYGEIRKLNELEKDNIDLAIACESVKLAIWSIYDFLKYPKVYRKVLEERIKVLRNLEEKGIC